MALSFPLTAAQFMELVRIQSARFWLPDATVQEGNEGGELFTAARGPRLWQAEFSLAPAHHADLDRQEARLALLSMPGASFFAYDPRRTGPFDDPDGTILGAATPSISAASGRDMTITGLPATYSIRRGDYIGFAYGASPTRYALHRAVNEVTAVAGVATNVEVVPPIRPATLTGVAVQLIRPTCKMVVVPGSVSYGAGAGVITGGATFRATQTLR